MSVSISDRASCKPTRALAAQQDLSFCRSSLASQVAQIRGGAADSAHSSAGAVYARVNWSNGLSCSQMRGSNADCLLLAFANAQGQMRQRFLHLVDQNQAQVAGLEPRQRSVDGQKLAAHFLDAARAAGVLQAGA